MPELNENECRYAGIDPKTVRRIAAGIERYAQEAKAIGIEVFGGSSMGSLRVQDGKNHSLVLATMLGSWNGGDGSMTDDDGLMRGE